METRGLVVRSGQGRVWEMAAGRSSALKLLGGETGESVMMCEETAPSGTETTYHARRVLRLPNSRAATA
jgi:hypothetical protein